MTKILFRVQGVKFSHIKDHISIWNKIKIGELVQLEREPDNKWDPNAIKVLYEYITVGYVPKNTAVRLARILDNNRTLKATVTDKFSDPTDRPVLDVEVEEV
jgi:hypothetical protein